MSEVSTVKAGSAFAKVDRRRKLDPLLMPEKAAEWLGITLADLQNLTRRKIVPVRIIGGKELYSIVDVEGRISALADNLEEIARDM